MVFFVKKYFFLIFLKFRSPFSLSLETCVENLSQGFKKAIIKSRGAAFFKSKPQGVFEKITITFFPSYFLKINRFFSVRFFQLSNFGQKKTCSDK